MRRDGKQAGVAWENTRGEGRRTSQNQMALQMKTE